MSDQAVSSLSKPAWSVQRQFKRILEGQRTFVLVALAFVATGSLLLPNPGLLTLPVITQFLLFNLLSLIYAVVAHILAHLAASRSLNLSVDHAFKNVLALENLSRAVPSLLLIGAFMFTFPSFKSHIPELNPYSWDPMFAQVDRVLHFGKSPWQWLEEITGYGAFTIFIDKVYYLWFPVTFASAAVAVTASGDSALRHRFLLTFVLSWIVIGCMLATGLSSVGPIFYDRLHGGASEFTALVARLVETNDQSPLQALVVRDMLWQSYTDSSNTIVSGISAMPSMHNAICVLLFLAARHVNRWLALGAALYAFAIFAGSVHLGWHYAVDGYAAAVLVAILWKAAGYAVTAATPQQPA